MKMYQQIDKFGRSIDNFLRPEGKDFTVEEKSSARYPLLNDDSYDDLKVGEDKRFTGTTYLKRIA